MATKEQREITVRLKNLRKEIARNEELMCKAAIAYEDLVAEKQSLESNLDELQKAREEMRQQAPPSSRVSSVAASAS